MSQEKEERDLLLATLKNVIAGWESGTAIVREIQLAKGIVSHVESSDDSPLPVEKYQVRAFELRKACSEALSEMNATLEKMKNK